MGKMKELEIDRPDLQTDDDFEFDRHVEELRQQEREEYLRDKHFEDEADRKRDEQAIAELKAERETRLHDEYMNEKCWWLAIDADTDYQKEQGEK